MPGRRRRSARALAAAAAIGVATLFGLCGCDVLGSRGPVSMSVTGLRTCGSGAEAGTRRFVVVDVLVNRGGEDAVVTDVGLTAVRGLSAGTAVDLGRKVFFDTWALPLAEDADGGDDDADREPVVGSSIPPGAAVQVAVPVVIDQGRSTAESGPIRVTYRMGQRTYRTRGALHYELTTARCG